MQESSRRARAALALAALLFALPLAEGAPPPAACPAPSERRAAAGHSTQLACAGGAAGRPVRGPARSLVGLPIDPNQADAATLECLPGIGPARAQAIVAARGRRRFERLGDLERVPGIGPRTLAGLAGWLGVGEPPPSRTGPGLGPSRPDPVGCAASCRSQRPQGDS